ncbi:endo-1,4-beta-xylanase [Kitasatospora sp. McL0602]|uniref:endo-1,4-beta-xylanase n=1 Tax=Kitasatospora sp. McL0602 TaxID=3439530 RepID=UPI003F88AA59
MTRSARTSLIASLLCATALSLLPAAAGPAAADTTSLKSAAEAKGIYFGGEITQDLLSNSAATSLAAAQFDMITPGNEMKWDTTEASQGNFNFGPGDAIVGFAGAHGMRVRGHNLVWYSQLPGWVGNLPTSQVKAAMENHITTEASHYRGQVYAWDVVNEPFDDGGNWRSDPFHNAMGDGFIADALTTAHAADPNAKLYINDYNIEGVNAKSNALYNLAKSLKSQGVPLDGIGFESHFVVGQVPADLQANMARFTALGLNVAVTELDDRMRVPAGSGDLAQQATDDANIVHACLDTSGCVGISQWAVADPDSWVSSPYAPAEFHGFGSATLFDLNYQPKASYNSVVTALGGSGGGGGGTPVGGSTSLGAGTWLVGAGSGRCLDGPAGVGDGAQMQIWDCSGAANQAFVLGADGTARTQNNECLDAPNGAGNGARVQLWSCWGGANQKWSLNLDGSLVNTSSGLCASTSGSGTGNGTAVILWQCWGGSGQHWGFNAHPLVGAGSGRCLDEPSGAGNGTKLQIWDCWGGANQNFTLAADGTVRDRSGRCLDAPTGAGNGARLQIWDCSGAANQKWVLGASGAVTNPASGLSLDVTGNATANGSPVQLWASSGAVQQKWSMR